MPDDQQEAFPHSSRARPSQSTNAFLEFWRMGGRRIAILYFALGIMLYLRSFRSPATPAVHHMSTTFAREPTCKTIHFIRHGEATHNRDAKVFEDFYEGRHKSPIYHDAPLTEAGHAQAADLRRVLENHKPEIAASELVVSSTLRRALQTARAAFPAPRRILVTDLCRERIALYASDKRRSLQEVSQEFSHIEFAEVDGEHDNAFDTRKEMHPDPYDSQACKDRARKFVDWLIHDRPEKTIVVVTHWVFLTHLFKVENIADHTTFQNGELRSIKLCREYSQM